MKRQQLLIAISSAMASMSTQAEIYDVQSTNKQYMEMSRGKGKGGGLSAMRIFSKSTNDKKPHQGGQECARRLSQGY